MKDVHGNDFDYLRANIVCSLLPVILTSWRNNFIKYFNVVSIISFDDAYRFRRYCFYAIL
jgi:hypothetical protein